eukprot:COSAG04_NODE_317_length_16987_cov_33.718025_2_plen_134_part_00
MVPSARLACWCALAFASLAAAADDTEDVDPHARRASPAAPLFPPLPSIGVARAPPCRPAAPLFPPLPSIGVARAPPCRPALTPARAPGRWQNGQLMFSAVEVELLMGLVFIVGMMYICWNTMPDGSGREGKYL